MHCESCNYQRCSSGALWLVRFGEGLFHLCYGGHALQLQGFLELTGKGPELYDACAQPRQYISNDHKVGSLASSRYRKPIQ